MVKKATDLITLSPESRSTDEWQAQRPLLGWITDTCKDDSITGENTFDSCLRDWHNENVDRVA